MQCDFGMQNQAKSATGLKGKKLTIKNYYDGSWNESTDEKNDPTAIILILK